MKLWILILLSSVFFISGCNVSDSDTQDPSKYYAILRVYDIDNQTIHVNATYEIYKNQESPVFISAGNISSDAFTQVILEDGNYTIKAFSNEYYLNHKNILIRKEQFNNLNSNEMINIYLRKKANLGDYKIEGDFEDLKIEIKNINYGYYDNLNYCFTWSHNIERVSLINLPKNIKIEKASKPPRWSSKVDDCYSTNLSINNFNADKEFDIHIDKFGVFNNKDVFMFWIYDNPVKNQGIKLDNSDFVYTIEFSEIDKIWKKNLIQVE